MGGAYKTRLRVYVLHHTFKPFHFCLDIDFFFIHSFKLFCLFVMTAQLERLIKTEPERFHTGLSSSLHWENVWIIMVQYPQRVLTWADFRELTETYCCSARATVRDSSEFLRRKHDGSESLFLRLLIKNLTMYLCT